MKALVFAAALALAGAAQATQPTIVSGEGYQGNTDFVSTRTRAEVKAETLAALRRGEILNGEHYPMSMTSPMTMKTRAEVKAELALALSKGEIRFEQ